MIFVVKGTEHSVCVKIRAVYSLLQIVMLWLISQMLRNGQVLRSAFVAFYFNTFIFRQYEDC